MFGRVHVQADDIADLVEELRSSDSLNVSVIHGLSPNAFQIQPTDDAEIPEGAARSRVDQCVASMDLSFGVRTTTASTSASVILRGAPGRGPSINPSRRLAKNRLEAARIGGYFGLHRLR